MSAEYLESQNLLFIFCLLLFKHREETFFQEPLLFKVEVLLLPIHLFPKIKKNKAVVRSHSSFASGKAKWVSSFPLSGNKNPVQCHHDRFFYLLVHVYLAPLLLIS
jgi:hypothetical protein